VPIRYETGCAPQSVWMRWSEEKSLVIMDTIIWIDILLEMTLLVSQYVNFLYLKLGLEGGGLTTAHSTFGYKKSHPVLIGGLGTGGDKPSDYSTTWNRNLRCPHTKSETTQTKERSWRLWYAAHRSWNRGEIVFNLVKDICHYYSGISRGTNGRITHGYFKLSCN
jgi:hypothetical protein